MSSEKRSPESLYSCVFRRHLLAGRVSVVTGAGSGIGRCVAHELTSLGATVARVGRNRQRLESVATKLKVSVGRPSIHICDVRDQEPSLVPLQRLGTVSEVSSAIVFLLSNAAAFITGTTLRVDGGVPIVRPNWPDRSGRVAPRYFGFDDAPS